MPRSGMQSLAVVCMLLTVGTIVVPRGDLGVDGLVAGILRHTREKANVKSSAFIARMSGTRQCTPLKPENNPQRVRHFDNSSCSFRA